MAATLPSSAPGVVSFAGPSDQPRRSSVAPVSSSAAPANQPIPRRTAMCTPLSTSCCRFRYMITNRNSTMIAPA